MAAAGKSRFAVTCAILRQYMRKSQGQGHKGDLARLFQAPPLAQPVASGENDDMTMPLFPVRAAAMEQPAGQERPEVMKKAPVAMCYKVSSQVDEAQMRAASLQRFLRKRKLRLSDTNPGDNENSMPAKKQKDTAAAEPLQDVPDQSWLRL